MGKKVKVTVTGMPLVSTSVPLLVGTHGPFVLEEKDIFKCILGGAKVVEIFNNGFEKVLTLSNYNDAPETRYFSEDKPEKVHLEPSKEELKGVFEETAKEVAVEVTPEIEVESAKEESVGEATSEVVEEAQVEEVKSPEHWMPPQRDNNSNNNNHNRNNNNGKNGKNNRR